MNRTTIVVAGAAWAVGFLLLLVRALLTIFAPHTSTTETGALVADTLGTLSGSVLFLAVPAVLCIVSLRPRIHKVVSIVLCSVAVAIGFGLVTQYPFAPGLLFIGAGILGIIAAARKQTIQEPESQTEKSE